MYIVQLRHNSEHSVILYKNDETMNDEKFEEIYRCINEECHKELGKTQSIVRGLDVFHMTIEKLQEDFTFKKMKILYM